MTTLGACEDIAERAIIANITSDERDSLHRMSMNWFLYQPLCQQIHNELSVTLNSVWLVDETVLPLLGLMDHTVLLVNKTVIN